MQITANETGVAGVISVTLTASFTGDSTDVTDQQRIQTYGDPKINLGGLFTDPSNSMFQFVFPASELYVGLTTQMANYVARFMTVAPLQQAPSCNQAPYNTTIWTGSGYGCSGYQTVFANSFNPNAPLGFGKLDAIVTDANHAASVWITVMETRITAALATLRALTPPQITPPSPVHL